MSKTKSYLSFILISIVGSVLTFYLGNFIFADIGNNAYGWNGWNIFVTIPAVMLCFQFIALSMLIVRSCKDFNCKNRTILLYLRIIIAFSIIGIVGVFLSAKYSYGTLFSMYPFPYYLVIFLVLNIVIIIGSILIYIKTKKHKEAGWEHKKITIGYVLYSIFIAGFTFYSYYKFGALLLSPLYVQVSTLYMTWPVYVWLAVPMLLLCFIARVKMIHVRVPKAIIYLSSLLILSVSLSVTYFIISYHNTLFISAISPAFGLDRLATNPYVAMFHAAITVIIIIVYLIKCFVLICKGHLKERLFLYLFCLIFSIYIIASTWSSHINDINNVFSNYVSHYSSPAEESTNLYHDYIFSLPYTYQETTEDGEVIHIMNLDEAFGCMDASDGHEGQEIIDNDVICELFNDFYHHNTYEFLEYFWAFPSFDRIIINGKSFRCEGYTTVFQDLITKGGTDAKGRDITKDGVIGFITCKGDGYADEERHMAILIKIN